MEVEIAANASSSIHRKSKYGVHKYRLNLIF